MPKMKLTLQTVNSLKPQAKEYVAWDTELKGFGCKVTPKGKRVFIVQYRGPDGTVRKLTLGAFGALTPQLARDQAQIALLQIAQGCDPQREKTSQRQKLSATKVNDLFDDYCKRHLAQLRTKKEAIRMFQRDVLPALGTRSIHDIGKSDVQLIIDKVMKRGSRTMANRLHAALGSFFNWAKSQDIIERSPCEGLRKPTQETSRERCLQEDELRRILIAAEAMPYPYGPIVLMLAYTGQRRKEVAGMTLNEIDIAQCVWSMSGARTKNRKPHKVHLSPSTVTIIREAPCTSALVFSLSASAPFQGWSKSKAQLDAKANVTNWRLHDLRRTMVTHMARDEIPLHVADKILNHKQGTISGVEVARGIWTAGISGVSA